MMNALFVIGCIAFLAYGLRLMGQVDRYVSEKSQWRRLLYNLFYIHR